MPETKKKKERKNMQLSTSLSSSAYDKFVAWRLKEDRSEAYLLRRLIHEKLGLDTNVA